MLKTNVRREEICNLAVTTGMASMEELAAKLEVIRSTQDASGARNSSTSS